MKGSAPKSMTTSCAVFLFSVPMETTLLKATTLPLVKLTLTRVSCTSVAMRLLLRLTVNLSVFPGERLVSVAAGLRMFSPPLSSEVLTLVRVRASTTCTLIVFEVLSWPSPAVILTLLVPLSSVVGVKVMVPVLEILNNEVLSKKVMVSASMSFAATVIVFEIPMTAVI